MNDASVKRFSIFDPAIRFEHREFYERIVSELNGILPVCNQGESTAVEISENPHEQEQITELMKRVESFSGDLLEVTKKLFDQYYVAKEALNRSILTTTAYNKINTLDRNLLERTCDVRWWALETAFADCLEAYDRSKISAHEFCISLRAVSLAQPLLSSFAESEKSSGESTVISAREALASFSDGLTHAALLDGGDEAEILIRDLSDFPSLLKLGRVDACLENLSVFTSHAGSAAEVIDNADALIDSMKQLRAAVNLACDRLEDIRASYTLYRDIVLAAHDGTVVANANRETRSSVLGISIADEGWHVAALATRNGTEYHTQDLAASKVETQQSLVYAAAVREGSNENGKPRGVMGVFFDFQGEAAMILQEGLGRGAPEQDGCYTLFTDQAGTIIASTDQGILRPGESAHIPLVNRRLKSGERTASYIVFEGIESAVFSACTDGYLDYRGLGWCSHVIVPKSYLFELASPSAEIGVNARQLMDSRIIPEINKQTYLRVQDDKESIQLISLNGIVFASKLGKRGGALGPIFNRITRTGDFVTSRMEEILEEMALGELDLNLKALVNFSRQAIDLVDRNLFERAADIRWWSTDRYFFEALENPDAEHAHKASERLKVINGSYTMYRNIVLADDSGDIIACSRTELRNELSKINVSDHVWFQQGMRTARSDEYAVQDVQKSPLERSRDRSLIYTGGVRRSGSRTGESIGVLGILFDWDTEAKKILSACLPRTPSGEIIDGSAAFYTNATGEIIETSNADAFPVGSRPALPERVNHIDKGETAAAVFDHGGTQFLLGSSRTRGYREYEGLGWCAHVVRPLY